MRQFIKRLARSSIHALPYRVRDFALRTLLDRHDIRTVVAHGDQGAFEGFPADFSVFHAYLVDKVWGVEAVNLFCGYFSQRNRDGTFVDIGANIGLIVVPVVKRTAVRGVAIEADPTNFGLLRANLLRNGILDRVDARNIAVFDQRGTVELELSPDNRGDHRVRLGHGSPGGQDHYAESDRRTIHVEGDRLDAIVDADTLRRPIAIKLDIQGSEPFAFGSGARLMALSDVLLFEFWPYGIKRLGLEMAPLMKRIREYFEYGAFLRADHRAVSAPESNSLLHLRPVEAIVDELMEMSRTVTWEHADIVLAKSSRL